MKLEEVFEHLITGELINTNVGLNLEEGVSPLNYRKLVNIINLGLLDLYARFPIRTQQAYIQLYENISLYHLRKEYCETNTASTEPTKYIIDTVDNPLHDRVLKIDAAYTEVGDPLPLEDEHNPASLFLPEVDTIQVMYPSDYNAIFVMYRAAPNKLNSDMNSINCEQEFNLPYSLLQSLLTFVTYKVYESHTSPEMLNKSTLLQNKYEMQVQEHIRRGLVTSSFLDTSSLELKGWV